MSGPPIVRHDDVVTAEHLAEVDAVARDIGRQRLEWLEANPPRWGRRYRFKWHPVETVFVQLTANIYSYAEQAEILGRSYGGVVSYQAHLRNRHNWAGRKVRGE